MSGPRRPGGADPTGRRGRGRPPAGYTEEAILSDEEVERRINVEGGGKAPLPPPEHVFRDPDPAPPTERRKRRGRPAASVPAPAAAAAGSAGAEPPAPVPATSALQEQGAGEAPGHAGADAPPPATPTADGVDPMDGLRARLRGDAPQAPSAERVLVAPTPALAAASAADPAATAAQPVPPATVEVVRRRRLAEDDRRRQLWRDSATILIGVVLVLLVSQAVFPAPVVGPGGSPTPPPSGINIGSLGPPPPTIAPGGSAATIGPIIDPSLGIDATPTPIPVITMGPTPSPSPSPSPSPAPTATRKPSPKPTVKPTPSLMPSPEVSPPLVASAQFTWSADGLAVTFTNTSTGIVTGETAWLWDFDDGTTSTARNPGTHVYLLPPEDGSYVVTLTMTTPVDSDSVSHAVLQVPSPT